MKRMHKDFRAFRNKLSDSTALTGYQKREAPDASKLAEMIKGIGTGFEAHKQANDEAIAEIRKNGVVTPETRAKLDKIDEHLNEMAELKKGLEKLQTKLARPGAGTGASRDEATEEERNYKQAWLRWVRSPKDPHTHMRVVEAGKAVDKLVERRNAELGLEQRDVTTTTGGGNFAVPEQISRDIARLSVDLSDIRSIARVVTAGTPDYKELVDVGGAAFEWVGEADPRNVTNTPVLAEVAPTFGMASARPVVTEESLNDIFFNVEDWVIESAAEAIAKGEGVAFVSGNGTRRPTGFLAGPAPVVTADATRAFGTLQYIASGQAAAMPASLDVLHDMVYALRARYRSNARWAGGRPVLSSLRKYKDTTNQYLWQPSTQLGQPDMFMGFPVSEIEDMPTIAANAFPLAFGDFREGYLIVDLVGMRMTRDEITLPGYVRYYIRKRVGGRLKNTEAIKLLRIATT
jgi:HK97 family phage major capsid protein